MTNPVRRGNTPALTATKTFKIDKEAERTNLLPSSKMFVVVGIGILGLVIVIVLLMSESSDFAGIRFGLVAKIWPGPGPGKTPTPTSGQTSRSTAYGRAA